jgi:predicted nucleotide-binding protein
MQKARAIDLLNRAISEIPALKRLRRGSPEFQRWHRNTEVAISKVFGESGRHVKDFTDIYYSLRVFSSGTPDSAFQEAYESGLTKAESVLQSMVEEIDEYWDSEEEAPVGTAGPVVEYERNATDVFVVHGRDGETKELVARFLERLGLNPIILHEQPNEGRTLIEKFERYSAVGFAVVLLTPDDVGALADTPDALLPRARQNVVLELGYFMGRLTRSRVCALTDESVELPSDVAGVVYVPLDVGGAWRIALVRELKASGFSVDANLAL